MNISLISEIKKNKEREIMLNKTNTNLPYSSENNPPPPPCISPPL